MKNTFFIAIYAIVKSNRLETLMKNVLVTGASHGIGKAIAEAFASKGHRVFLNCKTSKNEIKEMAEKWSEKYETQCFPLVYDVADHEQVIDMFKEIHALCDGIDILINNAGISYIGVLDAMSIDSWNNVIQTNLTSVFSCCKCAMPSMIHKKQGRIINISSVWGNVGASCEVAYSASKGGVNSFTKALAKELAPSNIAVNAIACGTIDTRMNACFSEEERMALAEEIPAGRFGTTEEVAALALQLAESPTYLTGQILTMDGGWC